MAQSQVRHPQRDAPRQGLIASWQARAVTTFVTPTRGRAVGNEGVSERAGGSEASADRPVWERGLQAKPTCNVSGGHYPNITGVMDSPILTIWVENDPERAIQGWKGLRCLG